MEKNLILARQDFIDDIQTLINSSELPMFVIGDILEKIQKQVKNAERNQYLSAKQAYEESLKGGRC